MKLGTLQQAFRNKKFWYTFFCTPNNMFPHTVVHLTFRAPQIVACGRVDTNVHLLQR